MVSQSLPPLNITLRPVALDDHDFLVQVYGSTRAAEMDLVPWTSEQRQAFVLSQFNAQQEHYGKTYPTANHDIILSNGRRVGRLYVARLDQEIRIVDICLLPEERNSGIGSYLIKQLLFESRHKQKITRIYVEEFNPSMRLFERLGFTPRQQQGIHSLMEWRPDEQTKGIGD
jgi:RimJ/RimL family protein N-acetyltransferase